ncbi:hypothetical protein F2P81_016499 [Scophthalmus maximus]|uniref:Uncharacterized protein n=1 Tax=Scophthalmus maximus TaxID=52904 RepID=A0A6A4SLM6_SCOMX|nr:hypothetical protein F2P81_016499 [Scophthalmus maximus]
MKENLDGLVQAKERIEDVHIVQLVHIQDKRFQLNFKADEKIKELSHFKTQIRRTTGDQGGRKRKRRFIEFDQVETMIIRSNDHKRESRGKEETLYIRPHHLNTDSPSGRTELTRLSVHRVKKEKHNPEKLYKSLESHRAAVTSHWHRFTKSPLCAREERSAAVYRSPRKRTEKSGGFSFQSRRVGGFAGAAAADHRLPAGCSITAR